VSSRQSPTVAEVARVAEFRVALRRFLHGTERVAREVGITPRWYLLLLLIKGAPDLKERSTVTELAARLRLAQSSVTELVARAEQAGLVRRERSSEDGRVVYLRLTAEGEERLAQAFEGLAAERRALREAIAELEPETG
jgi:DNA-binding MarR family transcriptional regulator